MKNSRDTRIDIRTTAEEKKKIEALAARYGLNISTFLRDTVLNRPIEPRGLKMIKIENHYQLGCINSNLARIALALKTIALNGGNIPPDTFPDLQKNLDELRALINRLQEDIAR